jgi:ribosomal protein L40E
MSESLERRRDDDEIVIVPMSDDDALELFDHETENPFAVVTQAGDSNHTGELTIAESDTVVVEPVSGSASPERIGSGSLVSTGGEGVAHVGSDGPGLDVVVECPGCGTICEGVDPRPTAAWFCPNCDYPLFLAAPAPPAIAANSGLARRRLPGTDGREVVAAAPCWACGERNPIGTLSCIRCNSQLVRPAPPAPLESEVAPVETAAVPLIFVARRWPLLLGGALGGAIVTVLITLLVT